MQRYVFYAEAKCRAGIKNVKRETKDVVSGLSGNLVGISINLCKSIQKELFINDTP